MTDTTPQSQPYPDFIPNSGACLATKNVLAGVGVRWMTRDEPAGYADNGWRIMSQADTTEYLSDNDNWQVVAFNQVCDLEPALIGIYELPVGSDLQIVRDERGVHIVDTPTGREIPTSELFPHASSDPEPDPES